MTHAVTSEGSVFIERFGYWPDLFFTLRNMSDTDQVTTEVALGASALGLPTMPLSANALLGGSRHPLGVPGATRRLSLTLAPRASEILHLSGWAVYVPVAIR